MLITRAADKRERESGTRAHIPWRPRIKRRKGILYVHISVCVCVYTHARIETRWKSVLSLSVEREGRRSKLTRAMRDHVCVCVLACEWVLLCWWMLCWFVLLSVRISHTCGVGCWRAGGGGRALRAFHGGAI